MRSDILLREQKVGAFPFRLGTTSYILPADIVPNVEFLAPLVDDVELVFFESDKLSNLPDAAVIEQLVELKGDHRLSYTVHLPLDIHLGSSDEVTRTRSVEKCRRIMDVTGPLAPFAYIIHFHGERRGKEPAHDIERWRSALDRSTEELLLSLSDVAPKLLCVETLDYPFDYVSDIVSRHGLSVCLDVGHLAFYGYPVQDHLDTYMAQTRVIHLHGNSDGTDHKDIGMLDPEIIAMLTNRLAWEGERERVLTLEVFGRTAFNRSMEIMRRLVE